MNRLMTLARAALLAALLAGCSGGSTEPTCGENETVCGSLCVSTEVDPRHCGGCDNACEDGQVCTAGTCAVACPAGQTECGGGCFDTATSTAHCGACDNACASGELCVSGACEVTCPTGQEVCDGTCHNLDSDRAHCGACGVACAADELCNTGTCEQVCATSLEVCDGTCLDTRTDRNNCGACGNACGVDELCVSSACTLTCGGGSPHACGGGCTNLQSDPLNCGTCGNACGAGEVCNFGACAGSCSGGLEICGGACVNTQVNPNNCGACGTACAPEANGQAVCAAGTCGTICFGDYGDCNGDLSTSGTDGCETNLTSTASHCGACGNACAPPPNATAACVASTCGIGVCETGFGNCDGNDANGCETDTRLDDLHCGACNNACAAGTGCLNGSCEPFTADTCANPGVLVPGTQSVYWLAEDQDYLSPPICGSSQALAGPDLVFAYTATSTGAASVNIDKPASQRWASLISSGPCGTLTPELACISEFTAPSLGMEFGVSAGQTYFVYLTDTTSGTAPLDNPLGITITETPCADLPVFEVTSVVPADGSTTSEAAPAMTITTSRAVDPGAGAVVLTGDQGTVRTFPLSVGQVKLSNDNQTLTVATSAFAPGETVSLSFSGVVDSFCAQPLAAPTETFTTPAAACGPFGQGAVQGDVVARVGIGGATVTEYYVAPDSDPNGYVYYGGTTVLYRVPKAGGTREDVEALAGIADAQLGYTLLIDGQNIYTVDSSTTKTTGVVTRISGDGGATFGSVDMVTLPSGPADDIAGIAAHGGSLFMITHEATATVNTQIYTASADATTAPNMATLAHSFGASTYNNCRGMAADSQFLYTICRKGTSTSGSNHHVLKIARTGFAITELAGFAGNTTAGGAVHGVDGDGDGVFDFLYARTNQREVYFLCGVSGAASAGDVLVRLHASSTTSYGLGFDPVANELWAYEDLTSTASGEHELVRIQ